MEPAMVTESGRQRSAISPRSVYGVARDCMAIAKGDRAAAAEKYLAQLKSDKSLLAALMWPLLAIAVRSLMSDVDMQSHRMTDRVSGRDLTAGGVRAILARASAPTFPKMSPDQERESARTIAMRDWYSTRLYGGGTRLGDARRPDLLESAAKRFAQARGFMRGGNLEKEVAARLQNDKQRVRDVLTPEQIHDIARGLK